MAPITWLSLGFILHVTVAAPLRSIGQSHDGLALSERRPNALGYKPERETNIADVRKVVGDYQRRAQSATGSNGGEMYAGEDHDDEVRGAFIDGEHEKPHRAAGDDNAGIKINGKEPQNRIDLQAAEMLAVIVDDINGRLFSLAENIQDLTRYQLELKKRLAAVETAVGIEELPEISQQRVTSTTLPTQSIASTNPVSVDEQQPIFDMAEQLLDEAGNNIVAAMDLMVVAKHVSKPNTTLPPQDSMHPHYSPQPHTDSPPQENLQPQTAMPPHDNLQPQTAMPPNDNLQPQISRPPKQIPLGTQHTEIQHIPADVADGDSIRDESDNDHDLGGSSSSATTLNSLSSLGPNTGVAENNDTNDQSHDDNNDSDHYDIGDDHNVVEVTEIPRGYRKYSFRGYNPFTDARRDDLLHRIRIGLSHRQVPIATKPIATKPIVHVFRTRAPAVQAAYRKKASQKEGRHVQV